MKDPVLDYAKKILAGKIIAGPHVRDACSRHLRDLETGPRRGLFWDLDAAIYTIRFFETVLLLNGGQFEGLPFNLQPSQKFQIGSIFGWKRADGTRRFRRAYIEEAKGSGKSPVAAGIGLYCLIADHEARAEVYAAASKKDQAQVLFRDAVAMVRQSVRLGQRVLTSGVNPVWNIADLRTASFFRPISNDDGQSGPRPSCALCDELHEHRDSTVIEMLERGFKWRRQPLLMMITNAGSDRNSVCWQEHQHAVRVAGGHVEDDRTFAYVCAMDEDDDPLNNESCWIKANPLLGVTVTKQYLRDVVQQAKQIPAKLNNILRLHFCTWTDAERAWMPRETIAACLVEPESEDGEEALYSFTRPLAGKPVSVGIDLSAAQDLTAEAFVVETGETEVERVNIDGTITKLKAPTYDAWIEAWTPADTIDERSIRDSAHYDVWARQGWLRAPQGRHIRFDYPAAHLAEVASRFSIRMCAYDRYLFRRFEEELDALGLDFPLIEHPQGGKRRAALPPEIADIFKRKRQEPPQGLCMPASVIQLETLMLERRLRLFGNPVLISAMNHASFEQDPFGQRWFSKRRATGRIDPLVALAMAVGAATLVIPRRPTLDDFLRNPVIA